MTKVRILVTAMSALLASTAYATSGVISINSGQWVTLHGDHSGVVNITYGVIDCNGYSLYPDGNSYNNCYGNKTCGVAITGIASHGVNVYDCNITSNPNTGARFYDGINVTGDVRVGIDTNEVSYSEAAGVKFINGNPSAGWLYTTSTHDNGEEGIKIRSYNNLEFRGNRSFQNGRDGLDADLANNVLIDGSTAWGTNSFTQNGHTGIEFDDSTNITIKNNDVVENGYYVQAGKNSSGVSCGILSYAARSGISLEHVTNFTIYGNNVVDNARNEIRVKDNDSNQPSANGSVTYNTGGDFAGVWCTPCQKTTTQNCYSVYTTTGGSCSNANFYGECKGTELCIKDPGTNSITISNNSWNNATSWKNQCKNPN